MEAEEDLVQRVYEGFQATPELQSALAGESQKSLQDFRDHLRKIQDIQRRLYEQRTRPNRSYEYPRSRPMEASKPTYGKTPYVKPTPATSSRPPFKPFTPAEKHFNTDPSYLYKKCTAQDLKANHWMINCSLKEEKKKAFTANEEVSSEEEPDKNYRRMQRGYLALQNALDESSDDESSSMKEEEVVANFGVACRECKESFPSGNQLHSHLRAFNAHTAEATPLMQPSTIIDLTAQSRGEYPEGIFNCTETRVNAYRAIDSEPFTAVIDSGFGRSAVNRKLLTQLPHTSKTIKPLTIRGIGGRQRVSELATFVFYLQSTQGKLLKLRISALIFDDLGTELLISTDYIRAWNMVLDIPRQLAIFHKNSKIDKPMAMIRVQITRQSSVNLILRAAKKVEIPANSIGQIPVRLRYSDKTDLLFLSQMPEIPDGIVSALQTALTYSNQSSASQTVHRGAILGTAASINGGEIAYTAQVNKNEQHMDLNWLQKAYCAQHHHDLSEDVVASDLYHSNAPSTVNHIDEKEMGYWKVEKVVGKLVTGEATIYKVRWKVKRCWLRLRLSRLWRRKKKL